MFCIIAGIIRENIAGIARVSTKTVPPPATAPINAANAKPLEDLVYAF
jgi:hypothetical protein